MNSTLSLRLQEYGTDINRCIVPLESPPQCFSLVFSLNKFSTIICWAPTMCYAHVKCTIIEQYHSQYRKKKLF